MKFTYLDLDNQWEYTFDFDDEDWGWGPVDHGFLVTVTALGSDYGLTVQKRVQIHRDPVRIVQGYIKWAEYHLREDDPLVSPSARKFAQRLVNLLVFS
jgi:hypothetical protein